MNKDDTIFIGLDAVFWKQDYASLDKDEMDSLAAAIHEVLVSYGYNSEMVFFLRTNETTRIFSRQKLNDSLETG